MKVTPIDIAQRSFSKKVLGYDPQEVQEYLQDVATVLEKIIHERNSLKETLREKELSLLEYKDRDQVLKNTIATASQMAERLRQDAERESKLILADASQKAEMIIRDSRESMKKTYQEISDLKKSRLQFEANLKSLVQAHLTLIEQGEKYMPQPPNIQAVPTSSPNVPTSQLITSIANNIGLKTAEISPLASE